MWNRNDPVMFGSNGKPISVRIQAIDLQREPSTTLIFVLILETFREDVGHLAHRKKLFNVELDRFAPRLGELLGIVFAFLTRSSGIGFARVLVLCQSRGGCRGSTVRVSDAIAFWRA